MQAVPEWHWVVWNDGNFAGPNRPVCRAVIQRGVVSSTSRYGATIPTSSYMPHIVEFWTNATAGSWTVGVSVDGGAYDTSANIPYNASAMTVQTAVIGLSNVDACEVTGIGTEANPWRISISDPPSDNITVIGNQGGFGGSGTLYGPSIVQSGHMVQGEPTDSTLPWRSIMFNTNRDTAWKEIPGIVSINIDRRLNSDAATMTMAFRNQIALSAFTKLDLTHEDQEAGVNGPSRRQLRDLGFPGFYTYNRGTTPYSRSRWGHGMDPDWMDEFIPNRKIVTFQGYGTDGATNPWDDSRLVQTGVWLIDRVEYRADGMIILTCRDLMKLAIEQKLYPPIVPLEEYPLLLQIDHVENVLETRTIVYDPYTAPSGQEVVSENLSRFPEWDYNSSVAYYMADKRRGGPCGHGPNLAFDGDLTTYWMSIAHSNPGASSAYEWIEIDLQGNWFKRIKFYQILGSYEVFVSVMLNGTWVSSGPAVPYTPAPGGIDNGADIPYLEGPFYTPYGDQWVTIDLGYHYQADKVRLTFHWLAQGFVCTTSVPTPHRVGIADISFHAITGGTQTVQEVGEEEVLVEQFIAGNIRDYSDIAKLFAAWAGWYWPEGSPNDWMIENWSSQGGRVWGDFEYSGAYPVDPPSIEPSYWDNKSVADGLNQIREILGFIAYVDSTGGLVWRSPNIWTKGNFVTGLGYVRGEPEVVDENNVLLDYGVTLDDAALRSEIVVVAAPSPDQSSSVSPGWAVFRPGEGTGEAIPEAGSMSDQRLLGGQERVMIVPDYPFISQDEINKFGYLVTLWMHWSFRKSKFRIPGIAAFEPDDQIRIFERVTSEAFVHYITGVSSSMDLDKGTWYLDVDTHWLGEGPDSTWVVDYTDVAEASPALMAFLIQSGRLTQEETGLGPEFFEMPEVTMADGTAIYNDVRGATLPNFVFPELPESLPVDGTYTDATGTTGGGGKRGSASWTQTFWSPRCSESTLGSTIIAGAGDHPYQSETVKIVTRSLLISSGVWYAFRQAIKGEQIRVYPSTVSYNCRYVKRVDGTVTNVWSNHAYGIAIDVNPFLNSGWGYGTMTGDPDAYDLWDAVNTRITLGNGMKVFNWGGTWNTKDWMHFDVIVTPEEIRTHGVRLDGQPVRPII